MLSISNLLKQKSSKPKISSDEDQEKLYDKLSEIKIKQAEKDIEARAKKTGASYINLVDFPISSDAIRLVSLEDAKKYKLICFYQIEGLAKIGSTDVENKNVEEIVAKAEQDNDLKVELYLISDYSFDVAYKRYASLPSISKRVKGIAVDAKEFEKLKDKIKTFKDLNQEIKKTSMSQLVILIMASAVKSGSSDVHIEAEENEIKIRFRIDGVLLEVAEIAKKYWPQVIARIKLLSGLKMNIKDRPQDGRFAINLPDDKLDVRVSCLPTAYGESVVMRLLRSSSIGLTFDQLGFRDEVFKILEKQIERPNGMIMTTGPTGSGKTTTLYAILNKLNSPETKIITLEDPIEYHLKGISQSQIDKSKDYTFAKGLRSILRQDPDIVMIGEIRDLETSEIALQAALTGHMVVSTLHTNDAAGALPRFLGMGVKPYILAPAINAIIGQRLLRKICKKCKQEEKIEPEDLERVKKILSEIPENSGVKVDLENLKFYKGKDKKCDVCQGIGLKGRVGIYEVLTIDSDIEKEILTGQLSEYKMKELAKKQGMITMVQDGILKAVEGKTTVKEVFRAAE